MLLINEPLKQLTIAACCQQSIKHQSQKNRTPSSDRFFCDGRICKKFFWTFINSMGDAHGYWISALQALVYYNYFPMGDAHGCWISALQALVYCCLRFAAMLHSLSPVVIIVLRLKF